MGRGGGGGLTLLLADPLPLRVAHGGHVEATQPSDGEEKRSGGFLITF